MSFGSRRESPRGKGYRLWRGFHKLKLVKLVTFFGFGDHRVGESSGQVLLLSGRCVYQGVVVRRSTMTAIEGIESQVLYRDIKGLFRNCVPFFHTEDY